MTVKEVTAAQADGFRWVRVDFRGQNGFVRSDLVTLQGSCAALTGDDRLSAPVAATITQGFKSGHQGMDFGASIGMELRVGIPATIFRAQVCTKCTTQQPNITPKNDQERNQIFADPAWGFGYGNHIIVRHEFQDLPRSTQDQILRNGGKTSNAIFVLYAHLSRMDVQANQKIAAGTLIGATGHTGNSTGPHLHIEVAFGDQWGAAKKIHPMLLFAVPNITS
ncbi:MAG: M23 family metallopeptidase [Chloroflexi bacterium]|nr:M23 family metallopeptidase [Chloroflexota bacterium]